ncbi:MAG: hypothetical protein Q8876_03900 [Bacillota bacterium]|nr:hypothetical protein [Bacillota bacterium]
MTIITCDYDCIYQEDGYCKLEKPSVVTNHSDNECVHYVRVIDKNRNKSDFTDRVEGITNAFSTD